MTLHLLIALLLAHAAPDNTLRPRLRPITAVAEAAAAPDTLRGAVCDSIHLNGYDKPLRASVETMFITNGLADSISAVGITVEYLDLKGRKLHSRSECVRVELTPGDTRMVQLPTWDKNHSFFYAGGQHPRTSGVTPYRVRLSANYIVKSSQ